MRNGESTNTTTCFPFLGERRGEQHLERLRQARAVVEAVQQLACRTRARTRARARARAQGGLELLSQAHEEAVDGIGVGVAAQSGAVERRQLKGVGAAVAARVRNR